VLISPSAQTLYPIERRYNMAAAKKPVSKKTTKSGAKSSAKKGK
jgi:hypothetical protein